ncbi:flagellar assembly protein FliW [Paenibacillus popilliae]|uniref:Flagellar assembly factor FliW n=1 Tax=Paenibacillus popilliae TaxID=78057 RepID=A0ABY3ALX1_PAEPP|nr:flagellar assembly protein FliW [Paenibacillus sp. SDF0028]TQR43739.1 flagellar assembly protein FliW [Paenibacillus sp. SDF0028]
MISQQFSFKGSILGFEDFDAFDLNEIEGTSFYQLEALDNSEIKFVVINPFDWKNDYSFILDNSCKEGLKLNDPNDALVMNIVTIKDPFTSSTVNYAAPLVMNVDNGLAMQFVIQDNKTYSSKTPLFDAVTEGGE